jgi:uncharacterized protein YceK
MKKILLILIIGMSLVGCSKCIECQEPKLDSQGNYMYKSDGTIEMQGWKNSEEYCNWDRKSIEGDIIDPWTGDVIGYRKCRNKLY